MKKMQTQRVRPAHPTHLHDDRLGAVEGGFLDFSDVKYDVESGADVHVFDTDNTVIHNTGNTVADKRIVTVSPKDYASYEKISARSHDRPNKNVRGDE